MTAATTATTTAINIVVTSDYGTASRGRHSASIRHGACVQWADTDASGSLVITAPGTWQLRCTDGFGRAAKAVLTVSADGHWEMRGSVKRFRVLPK